MKGGFGAILDFDLKFLSHPVCCDVNGIGPVPPFCGRLGCHGDWPGCHGGGDAGVEGGVGVEGVDVGWRALVGVVGGR